MEGINNLLKGKVRPTVNSSSKSLSTVNSNKQLSEQIEELVLRYGAKPEYIADQLAQGLDDTKSKRYYLILAKEIPPEVLFESLSYTKMAGQDGRIRTKKAIYFQAILRRKGYKTKFSKEIVYPT